MEFTANDVRGFGVDGYDNYLSATVQFHTAAISGKDVPPQFSDSVSTNTFFLKILDRGFYSLYDLVSTERVYLFMQRRDSSISELLANSGPAFKISSMSLSYFFSVFRTK
jgi:hypothetical protein